jgi:hypothetical protein
VLDAEIAGCTQEVAGPRAGLPHFSGPDLAIVWGDSWIDLREGPVSGAEVDRIPFA